MNVDAFQRALSERDRTRGLVSLRRALAVAEEEAALLVDVSEGEDAERWRRMSSELCDRLTVVQAELDEVSR